MIQFLLHQLPAYLGFSLSGGLACFFASKYIAIKRDKAFKREAEKILDTLDAERRRHAEKVSAHRKIEQSDHVDNAMKNEKSPD